MCRFPLHTPGSVHRRPPCDKISADNGNRATQRVDVGINVLDQDRGHHFLASRVPRLNTATNDRLISKSLREVQKIDKIVTS